MRSVEYCLDFRSKSDAENALDYYENQQGYQDGWLAIPGPRNPHWHLRLHFAAEQADLLLNPSLLDALGVVHGSSAVAAVS